MEAVDVGSLSADEVLESLFEGGVLHSLLQHHGAACFTLVRSLVAPTFYRELIENVATIDATTRHHVAFVVFHGDRSEVYEDGRFYGVDPHPARIRLSGLSITEKPRDAPSWSHPAGRAAAPRQPLFSKTLAQQIRLRPSSVDDHILAHHMSRVATRFMERFDIRESSLPCLLFTDGIDYSRRVVVPLDPGDPLSSLYSDCLRPLSDQFWLLSKHWALRAEVTRKRRFIDYARAEIERLSQDLPPLPAKIEEERKRVGPRVSLLNTRLMELQQTLRGLDSASAPSSSATPLETKLQAEVDAIADGERTFRSPGHQEMELAKLTRRLQIMREKARQRHRSRCIERRRPITRELEDVSRQLAQERQSLNQLEQELRHGELHLVEQRKILAEYAPAVPIEEDAIRASETALQARGYRLRTLRGDPPSAFDAIEDISNQGLLGEGRRTTATGAEPAMRILFLAANPVATSRLDLEHELYALEREVRSVKHRDDIVLQAHHALQPDDLIRYVREYRPTVVHFRGYGSMAGIVLRSDTGGTAIVSGLHLRRFFQDRGVKVVVLNAGYSRSQAEPIADVVESVVGTTAAVEDEAARRFAVAFRGPRALVVKAPVEVRQR